MSNEISNPLFQPLAPLYQFSAFLFYNFKLGLVQHLQRTYLLQDPDLLPSFLLHQNHHLHLRRLIHPQHHLVQDLHQVCIFPDTLLSHPWHLLLTSDTFHSSLFQFVWLQVVSVSPKQKLTINKNVKIQHLFFLDKHYPTHI